jgi:hypothetical protein
MTMERHGGMNLREEIRRGRRTEQWAQNILVFICWH